MEQHPPNFPKVINCFPQCAGKPYIPSNGTEGDMFMQAFCFQCKNEKYSYTMNTDDPTCEILTGSMVEHKAQEWVYSAEGWPICTKWKFLDWGNDEDGWNEPIPPEPKNFRQLIMPFDLVGLLPGYDDFLVFPNAIIERELIEQ